MNKPNKLRVYFWPIFKKNTIWRPQCYPKESTYLIYTSTQLNRKTAQSSDR